MTILHVIDHCVLDHTGHSEHEEDEAFDISYEAAIYAYDYYLSWKRHHNRIGKYTDYEEKLLALYKKCA